MICDKTRWSLRQVCEKVYLGWPSPHKMELSENDIAADTLLEILLCAHILWNRSLLSLLTYLCCQQPYISQSNILRSLLRLAMCLAYAKCHSTKEGAQLGNSVTHRFTSLSLMSMFWLLSFFLSVLSHSTQFLNDKQIHPWSKMSWNK